MRYKDLWTLSKSIGHVRITASKAKKKGFLHRIITKDEKWIYYDNPKRLIAWVKLGEPGPLSAKRNIHCFKVMLRVWWDQKGIVYYELLKSVRLLILSFIKNN